MADELISRKALLAEMRRSGKAAYLVVQDAPAVDAVEVVRCGECKHCDFGVYLTTICTSRNNVVTKEGFCNRGERREDNAPD